MVAVAAGAVFVLFVAYALLAAFVLHGPVTPSSLNASVTSAVGTASSAEQVLVCDARGEQRWRCEIPDRAGSGGTVPYEVRTNPDSSCWDARLLDPLDPFSESMPRTVSGCVHRWQWW